MLILLILLQLTSLNRDPSEMTKYFVYKMKIWIFFKREEVTSEMILNELSSQRLGPRKMRVAAKNEI
jgi:squalene cyclase